MMRTPKSPTKAAAQRRAPTFSPSTGDRQGGDEDRRHEGDGGDLGHRQERRPARNRRAEPTRATPRTTCKPGRAERNGEAPALHLPPHQGGDQHHGEEAGIAQPRPPRSRELPGEYLAVASELDRKMVETTTSTMPRSGWSPSRAGMAGRADGAAMGASGRPRCHGGCGTGASSVAPPRRPQPCRLRVTAMLPISPS